MRRREVIRSLEADPPTSDEGLSDPNGYLLTEKELEDERFTYIPRRDFSKLSLTPSNTSPQPCRYFILDRLPGHANVPEYVICKVTAGDEKNINDGKDFSNETSGSNRSPSRASVDESKRGSKRHATPSSSIGGIPHLTPDYDLNDPPTLRISLHEIDRYVSQQEIELFENQRFANPRQEDLPRRTQTGSLSGSSRSGRPSHLAGLTVTPLPMAEKQPVDRPLKRRRGIDPIIVISAVKAPLVAGSMIASSAQPSALRNLDSSGLVSEERDMMGTIEADHSEDQTPKKLAKYGLKGTIDLESSKIRSPKTAAKYGMMAVPASRSTTVDSSLATASNISETSSSRRSLRKTPAMNYKNGTINA